MRERIKKLFWGKCEPSPSEGQGRERRKREILAPPLGGAGLTV